MLASSASKCASAECSHLRTQLVQGMVLLHLTLRRVQDTQANLLRLCELEDADADISCLRT